MCKRLLMDLRRVTRRLNKLEQLTQMSGVDEDVRWWELWSDCSKRQQRMGVWNYWKMAKTAVTMTHNVTSSSPV